MADTKLDFDLHFFVGHMDPVECEHPEHDDPTAHHGGYATFYVTMKCLFCPEGYPLFSICQPFVDYCFSGGMLRCSHTDCRAMQPGLKMLHIVSRIT